MISLFSKYAKVVALAIALMVAAPLAISAAPSSTGSEPTNFSGQNANRAFNGGGAPVKRKTKAKSKAKTKPKRKARRSTGHSGH